jgi:hypothetical protein
MSEENEPVIREPKVLSDFNCRECKKRGKVGVMRYQGTERGRVTVIEETFDECAAGGVRYSDHEIGITVHVWICNNCGRRGEDTLGY